MRRRAPSAIAALLISVMLALTACGDLDQTDRDGEEGDQEQAIRDVIQASVDAENAGDVDSFLELWTDNGLSQYDVGTREQLRAGENPDFGTEPIEIVGFQDTIVMGDQGSTLVDATVGEGNVVTPIYRVRFAAAREDGEWMLDGFEFLGSPPPAPGTELLNVVAKDFLYELDRTEIPGNLAFRFSNEGEDPHEITLFKGPDGVDVATAKAALENLDGQTLEGTPEGYQADHVSFAESGNSNDVTFAQPLEAGTYVLVCYLPRGGFTDQGEQVDPQGSPHVQLGMISTFTVN